MTKKNRNYVFTIHKTTKKIKDQLHKTLSELSDHNYAITAIEHAPTTGKQHIQGYIELNDPRPFKWLLNYFNLTYRNTPVHFHIEPARGNAQHQIDYLSKEDDPRIYGEPKSQGKRTDLLEIKKKIKANPHALKNIVRDDCNNYQQLKFAENIQKYFFTDRDPAFPPRVIWLFGSSGSGKTSAVYNSFASVCSVSDFHWLGDGYHQQECFLLDDFREHDISFNKLLKIIDRYPYTLPVKGSSVPLNSPYIVITTPRNIDDTYYGNTEEIKQLKRRVIEIEKIEDLDLDLKNI